MSQRELKVGDPVLLKSGGPSMTITRIVTESDGAKSADCAWFGDAGRGYDQTAHRDEFPVTALTLDEEREPGEDMQTR